MPNKRRSTTHRAAPKLFRCTGYGNCDMVFTRSEHLARHERKHTGEKPYKCVVPGCGRMFSRFDNMMQHTQTHEKNRKPVATPAKEVTSVVHGHRVHAPSLTPIKTESWPEEANHTIPDLEMATSMVDSRTLPPPTRRSSFSSFGGHMRYPPTSSHPSNVNYQSSYPSSNLPPTSYYQYNEYQNVNNVPRNRASWPIKRDAYHSHSNHPHYPTYLSLSNHFNDSRANDFYYDSQRRSSISTASSDSNLTSPVSLNFPQEPVVVRRRISIDDLRLPIENFRNIQLEEDGYHQHYVNPTKSETVDITPDEYEALQGFSKFHSKPVVAREESPYSSGI
ncbi:unnamed protein product [Mucor hiemalis]